MRISNEILAVLLATVIGFCGWLAVSVTDLKVDVAAIKTQLKIQPSTIAKE